MAINGFDAYITASPYDDDPDFADMYDLQCPGCEEEGCAIDVNATVFPELECECEECGHKWKVNVETPILTKDQEVQISAVQERLWDAERAFKRPKGPTVDEYFSECPEGDFNWDDGGVGDMHVYCCGESDCEQQWHTTGYSETIGRKDGKRYVHIHNVDCDGNSDIQAYYDEREKDEAYWDDCQWHYAGITWDYFHGWALYWIDAAVTGDDPCDQTFRKQDNWVDFCLKAATDDIEYIESINKRGY
jgi:hypothetical protein